MSEIDLDELRSELDGFAKPAKAGGTSAKDQRIIAGFEEINRFVEEHGRAPQHGEDLDIFERIYAVRLDRLRASSECRSVLRGCDPHGLLEAKGFGSEDESGSLVQEAPGEYRVSSTTAADPSDEELLAALTGGEVGSDLTVLKHVRTAAEKRAADEIALRTPCVDFEKFRPLFERVEQEIKAGLCQTQRISADNRSIEEKDFFILHGITLYVAEVGEPLKTTAGEIDRRLRLIFGNGTESNLLLRSLQRAFYDDPAARRVVIQNGSTQLTFGGELEPDDVEAGTIYILRSESEHPFVVKHRALLHKIGVTGGNVKTRIANAKKDPTYLLAQVEIVATFKLANINRKKLEALLHKFFGHARMDMELEDRFGSEVSPREWFLVPLSMIQQAIEMIRDGSVSHFRYDPQSAEIVPV